MKNHGFCNCGKIFEKIEFLIKLRTGGSFTSQCVNKNIKLDLISFPKILKKVEKIILISSVNLVVFPFMIKHIIFIRSTLIKNFSIFSLIDSFIFFSLENPGNSIILILFASLLMSYI